MRVCEWCGASLEGRRSDARYCGGARRAADSRARRSEAHTIRLRPVAERDRALRDYIERTRRAEADDS
jgi:hypothetical protein